MQGHVKDESQRQQEERVLRSRMAAIGRKILVLSGKGGVGKSTVAANLAVSLAKAGQRVGLLDVDLHGPSIPKILGIEGARLAPDPSGGIKPIEPPNGLKVVSIGLLLHSAADPVIWRGPMKYNMIRQFLTEVVWGELDCLVIDSPPGTGDEPLAVAQLVGTDAEAVIVTTPQDVAIADVRRSVSFCRTLELKVTGIVENMSGLACPHCGEVAEVFKTGGGEQLAAEMEVPFLGQIPLDPQITACGDSGKPFVQSGDGSATVAAFARIVKPILDKTEPQTETAQTGKAQSKMKIAIPTANGRLALHFGHCEKFAVVEADPEAKTVGAVEYLTPPPHEPGVLPRWLHEQGANLIIAGGMGQRAQQLFVENGIQVVVGASAAPVEQIASDYLTGRLETGVNACDH